MVNACDVKIIAIKIVLKSWGSFKIYQLNCAGMVLNGFIFKRIDQNIREKKKPGSHLEFACKIVQPINSAYFHPKWAGLLC